MFFERIMGQRLFSKKKKKENQSKISFFKKRFFGRSKSYLCWSSDSVSVHWRVIHTKNFGRNNKGANLTEKISEAKTFHSKKVAKTFLEKIKGGGFHRKKCFDPC